MWFSIVQFGRLSSFSTQHFFGVILVDLAMWDFHFYWNPIAYVRREPKILHTKWEWSPVHHITRHTDPLEEHLIYIKLGPVLFRYMRWPADAKYNPSKDFQKYPSSRGTV